MADRGRFITLEGGEGAGKSTQCARLVEHLESIGHRVISTREPGGTAGAQSIRELVVNGGTDRWSPVAEALLMYAARRDHVERLIQPALDEGQWVVCDRFSDSTMAYQGYAHGLGRDWVRRLDALSLDGFVPDLTLLLDIPVSVGLERAAARGGPDRFEKLGVEFHESLRAAFLRIASEAPERVIVIDADDRPEGVTRRVIEAVDSWLSTGGARDD